MRATAILDPALGGVVPATPAGQAGTAAPGTTGAPTAGAPAKPGQTVTGDPQSGNPAYNPNAPVVGTKQKDGSTIWQVGGVVVGVTDPQGNVRLGNLPLSPGNLQIIGASGGRTGAAPAGAAPATGTTGGGAAAPRAGVAAGGTGAAPAAAAPTPTTAAPTGAAPAPGNYGGVVVGPSTNITSPGGTITAPNGAQVPIADIVTQLPNLSPDQLAVVLPYLQKAGAITQPYEGDPNKDLAAGTAPSSGGTGGYAAPAPTSPITDVGNQQVRDREVSPVYPSAPTGEIAPAPTSPDTSGYQERDQGTSPVYGPTVEQIIADAASGYQTPDASTAPSAPQFGDPGSEPSPGSTGGYATPESTAPVSDVPPAPDWQSYYDAFINDPYR